MLECWTLLHSLGERWQKRGLLEPVLALSPSCSQWWPWGFWSLDLHLLSNRISGKHLYIWFQQYREFYQLSQPQALVIILNMIRSGGVNEWWNCILGLSVWGILSFAHKERWWEKHWNGNMYPAPHDVDSMSILSVCSCHYLRGPWTVLSALPGDFSLGSLCEILLYHLWEISFSCLSFKGQCEIFLQGRLSWSLIYPSSLVISIVIILFYFPL